MEAINGVTFEDWGAACGNIAQGMTAEEVCEILGLELPVWQKTNDEWAGKLGDIMAQDMNMATVYGGFFTNPKVGKFAGVVQDEGSSLDNLLEKVPDFDAYQKIFSHQSIASEHGVDAVSILEEYDLNLHNWSQLGMHYSKYANPDFDHTSPEYEQRYREVSGLIDKWDKYYKAHYKNDAVDLAGDIDF